MMFNYSLLFLSVAITLLSITGCDFDINVLGENENVDYVSIDFESGSIGDDLKNGDTVWELSLADDNDDSGLPDYWRNWWYVKMNNLTVSDPVSINITNRGWPYYYLPVYTYDNKTWLHFSEDEVSQPSDYELSMEKQFESPSVSMARFYPYTFSDLSAYIQTIDSNPNVLVEIAGSTQGGYPIHLLTLTDGDISDSEKDRVWIHARTHPAETGPSFMLEGFINFLLSDTSDANAILGQFMIHIVPMQNVDGVVAGNYRTTPQTENLEVMWYTDESDTMPLTGDAPVEVTVLHQAITDLIDEGPAFTIALNLHASNSEPDIKPFFFPHFGPESLGYSTEQAALWEKHLRFINSMALHYGEDMLEPTADEGGSSFATKTYPESWWWKNFQSEVMAITIETTYGRAGYSPDWITPDNLRTLGESMALAIRDYSDDSIIFTDSVVQSTQSARKAVLKYPGLYPPNAADENKE